MNHFRSGYDHNAMELKTGPSVCCAPLRVCPVTIRSGSSRHLPCESASSMPPQTSCSTKHRVKVDAGGRAFPECIALHHAGTQHTKIRAILNFVTVCKASTRLPSAWDCDASPRDVALKASLLVRRMCTAPCLCHILEAAELNACGRLLGGSRSRLLSGMRSRLLSGRRSRLLGGRRSVRLSWHALAVPLRAEFAPTARLTTLRACPMLPTTLAPMRRALSWSARAGCRRGCGRLTVRQHSDVGTIPELLTELSTGRPTTSPTGVTAGSTGTAEAAPSCGIPSQVLHPSEEIKVVSIVEASVACGIVPLQCAMAASQVYRNHEAHLVHLLCSARDRGHV